MTKFFEPISASATHIYHSALELSPLSSNIRRLYYHHRHTPLPRVVTGTRDSWGFGATVSNRDGSYYQCTWSPCGQFVATQTRAAVEIRDSLTLGLISTLIPSTSGTFLIGGPAYSPDGCSIASFSSTSLIIWDIQTGGVAKEIKCENTNNVSLVWSLDGVEICTVLQKSFTGPWVIRICDVTSGTMWFPTATQLEWIQKTEKPYFLAHSTAFWVFWQMTPVNHHTGYCQDTISIFEVGSTFSEIKSFKVNVQGSYQIGSFSSITFHISILSYKLLILDTQNAKELLMESGEFNSSCFSCDGSLFAASSKRRHCVWRYSSGCYTPWKNIPHQDSNNLTISTTLQFSPTLSSILSSYWSTVHVLPLDGPPITIHPKTCTLLAVPSHCGTYMATCHKGNNVVKIGSFLSEIPSQLIDTDIGIDTLILTSNILVVLCPGMFAAWQLMEGGVVVGVFGTRIANLSDSIWSIPLPLALIHRLEFSVKEQTVVIRAGSNVMHAYNTETGEVFEPSQATPHAPCSWYHIRDMLCGRHYLHYHKLEDHSTLYKHSQPVSQTTVQGGWLKDPEEKHWFWMPAEWRSSWISAGWLSRTRVTPSMITQICQEIRDIKTGAQDSITVSDRQTSSTSELGNLPSNSPDQGHNDGKDDSCGTGISDSTVPVRPPKCNSDIPTRHDEDPPQADQYSPGMLAAPRSSHDPLASSERNDVSAFADVGRDPSAWPSASCKEKHSPSDSSSELSSPGTL